MTDILKDHTKFTKTSKDWMSIILKYQDRVSRFVDSLFKAKVITEEVKMKLKDSGSKPGRLYGLPKGHKTRTKLPFRPILSTMGT